MSHPNHNLSCKGVRCSNVGWLGCLSELVALLGMLLIIGCASTVNPFPTQETS